MVNLKSLIQIDNIKTNLSSIYYISTATCLSFRNTPDPNQFQYQRKKGAVSVAAHQKQSKTTLAFLMKAPNKAVMHSREDIKGIAMTLFCFRKPPDTQYNDIKKKGNVSTNVST